jgi:hypothetical protein
VLCQMARLDKNAAEYVCSWLMPPMGHDYADVVVVVLRSDVPVLRTSVVHVAVYQVVLTNFKYWIDRDGCVLT